ncbi:MAG: signal peptidase I [Actinomycetota bacterium]
MDITPRGVGSPLSPSAPHSPPPDDLTQPVPLPAFADTDEHVALTLPPTEDVVAGRNPRHRKRGNTRQVVEWLILIASALAIALLIKAFLFQAFYIPSDSMVPTLQKNDRVLVNKLSYKMHDVHRGDIVVFKAPRDENGNSVAQDGIKDLVKRVVGLPGDQLEARDGVVYVNGVALEEGYLPVGTRTEELPLQTVPPNSIFVMGDNRGGSHDSRRFGPISEDDIVGRVLVRIWPLSRVGFM